MKFAFLNVSPGFSELALVFVVILLLFGARNIPNIARTLGRAMESFRRAANDVRNEVMREADVSKDVMSSKWEPETRAESRPPIDVEAASSPDQAEKTAEEEEEEKERENDGFY